MNLYLISQTENSDYDTYDAAVVAAQSEDDARKIHPGGHDIDGWDCWFSNSTWVKYSDIDLVKVEYLGRTDKQHGAILASFNAG